MLWWVRDRFQSSLLDNTTLNVHGHCSSVIAFAFWQRCTHQAWSWAGELAQILQKNPETSSWQKERWNWSGSILHLQERVLIVLVHQKHNWDPMEHVRWSFFRKKNKTFLEVNYFCKKSPSNRLNWVLIMLLLIVDF